MNEGERRFEWFPEYGCVILFENDLVSCYTRICIIGLDRWSFDIHLHSKD